MSKVTESAEQSNAPKVAEPTWEQMISNPLLALTSFQTGVVGDSTWPYQVWYDYTNNTLERLKKSIRPDKPRSIKKEFEIIYLTGILELLEWLCEREAAIKDTAPEFVESLAHYKELYQLNQQYVGLLEEKVERLEKEAGENIALAKDCLQVCKDWQEMAYEDFPIPGDYLSRVNLAMRLQRPQKSN